MEKYNRSRIIKRSIVIAIILPIALLHFITGPHYAGPFPVFVNGYLIDMMLPFGFYFLLCLADSKFLRSWAVKASLIFMACFFVEMMQFSGIPLFGSTFDPLDIVMYGLGVVLAVLVDQLLLAPLVPSWRSDESSSPREEKAEENTFVWRQN